MRNSALAINIAKRYLGHGLEMQDLYQEGMQGIQKAVEKYDFRKNSTNQHNRFSTVAVHWTHQAIGRALANQSRTIRVPVHMHDRMIKVYSVRNRFETMHGRLPTSEELTQETGLSLQHVEAALEASHNHLVLSLDEPVREDDGGTFGDFIPQEAPAPQETAEQALFKEQVRQMVEELPPRERDIIKLRFGIGTNKPPMNLRDIGEIFGVTKERIRQLENKTLRNLKGEATKLKDFIE